MLKFIRNVPWEYGDVVADYHINTNTCVLYLRYRRVLCSLVSVGLSFPHCCAPLLYSLISISLSLSLPPDAAICRATAAA